LGATPLDLQTIEVSFLRLNFHRCSMTDRASMEQTVSAENGDTADQHFSSQENQHLEIIDLNCVEAFRKGYCSTLSGY
jgi:hypothetical protein